MNPARRTLTRTLRLQSAIPRRTVPTSSRTMSGSASNPSRNPHADFKKLEASRPAWESDSSFHYTKTPDPNWKLGSGANGTEPAPAAAAAAAAQHTLIDPYAEGRAARLNYKLLISGVVPRPIAFVSTRSRDGRTANLAPFSYFQLINHDPPLFVIGFAGGLPREAGGPDDAGAGTGADADARAAGQAKDTLANLADTGECVVNMVSEHFVEAANATSVDAPAGASEWAVGGLTAVGDCVTVACARVREAVFSVEARLESVREFESRARPGTKSGTLAVVEGTRFWVRGDALDEHGSLVDPAVLRPMSRLGGITYGRTTQGIELPRPEFAKDIGGMEGYERLKKIHDDKREV